MVPDSGILRGSNNMYNPFEQRKIQIKFLCAYEKPGSVILPGFAIFVFSVFISGNIQNQLTQPLSQQINLALQVFQKCACVCAIHLRVMELE